ncbi:MAG: stage II sporulation protein M [Brumimicrobium sp.]
MKETQFIEQNKEKWIRYEKKLSSSSSNPEEIRELYTELNNDLSYAQTFYEKRIVRSFLNNLTQAVHGKLYKQKKEPFLAIIQAWTVDLPLEIYRARKNLLFALFLFLIYGAIGAFSTNQDVNYATKILGEDYIEMTEQNIVEGNPLGVYGASSQGSMFLEITLNNIFVALLCFIGGAFFSIGTHIVLFQNGIMVGVFQYLFKLKGLLLTSFLTIWIHGAFEISAIIIASGAGFTLGHGLLFPGSYTRLQSLQMNGMRGVRIMLSLIPVFIMAGFLESYVTRHYLILPDWSKWMIILFSFTFILFYYVIYPALVARKYPEKVYEESHVNIFESLNFKPFKIRKNTDVFRETFQVYLFSITQIIRQNFQWVFPAILFIWIFQVFVHFEDMNMFYYVDWEAQLSILFGNPNGLNFNGIKDFVVSIAWIVPITFLGLITFYNIYKISYKDAEFKTFVRQRFFKMLIAILPFYALAVFLPFYIFIPSIFIFPFLLLPISSVGLDKKPNLKSGFSFSATKWSSTFIVFSLLCLATILLAQPLAFVFSFENHLGEPNIRDVLDRLSDFLLPVFADVSDKPIVWVNVVRQFFYIGFMLFLLPLFFIGIGLVYLSGVEERQHISLKNEFKKFGKRNRVKETAADFE